MIFNSFHFVLLVLVTFLLYYTKWFRKLQIFILIAASFIFYSAHSPILLLLLVSSIVINMVSSYYVIRVEGPRRKLYAIIGVTLNLLVLAFFKYSPMFGRSFFHNTSFEDFLISIPLPIGISFFTFQGISLVVDAFKSDKKPEYKKMISKNFVSHSFNSGLFIAFFPQLVAGPIVKAHEFMPQIKTKFLKDIDWEFAIKNIIIGYFLKMVVADNLKDQTFWMAFPYFEELSTPVLLTMLFGFSMQIFADFAGYSTIAIGVAALFGYRLRDNFLFPYISCSFQEFWRRWHISLSSFLKEYLYFSLGGNRKGKVRTYVNLTLTMALGGLWHGAAWSYMVWGVYHGLLLALERFLNEINVKLESRAYQIIKGFLVFFLVTMGWLLFKLPEFSHVIRYVQALFSNLALNPGDIRTIMIVFFYSLPVIIYHLAYLYKEHANSKVVVRLEPAFYGLMLFLILANSGSPGDFIYFQF